MHCSLCGLNKLQCSSLTYIIFKLIFTLHCFWLQQCFAVSCLNAVFLELSIISTIAMTNNVVCRLLMQWFSLDNNSLYLPVHCGIFYVHTMISAERSCVPVIGWRRNWRWTSCRCPSIRRTSRCWIASCQVSALIIYALTAHFRNTLHCVSKKTS